jgi:3-hydroxy acid dehydrogenase/malonic semialdehyde reductase
MNNLYMSLALGVMLVIPPFGGLYSINESTKTCLVTGASSGIGQHLAIEMVNRGWKVIGVARRIELLEELKKKLGAESFIPYMCDVSSCEQIHTVSESMKSQGLNPTLFFLNAGTGSCEPKWKVSAAANQRIFAVNYIGAIAWVEEWLPIVKQLGGGTFVATSSVMALAPAPGASAYGASKAALAHCFKSLRFQYFHDNIDFNVVFPGLVATKMLKNGGKDLPYVHSPEDEARYIVTQVFKGEKEIEPTWFWPFFMRLLNRLPESVALKLQTEFLKKKLGIERTATIFE